MDKNPRFGEVDDPEFLDLVMRVERGLGVDVEGERGPGHFYYELNIVRTRVLVGIKIVTGVQEGNIRLRLVLLIESNGTLDTYDGILHLSGQQLIEAIYAGCVAASRRRHGDDLAFDELDAVVLANNTCLGQRVILVNSEASEARRSR